MSLYAVVFPIFAARPVVAKALSRWGRFLLPLVLIAIGLSS
ncbi:cadmium resistance protein CadD (predicted permease) [Streptomyces sp. SAI-135]|jgi:cadmium resistance protein CadD (predicted permease)|nr:cadmium resistance protein CadD (predicted permease) [Streptomyces sp. SAI-090]MDH6554201.1 cadmium resistance protein CadD (predicted permease) [Streptomyces sp. SAI-041]MDH6573462.1 cadmium resistance protein CadD (predicted permease) [Streptomyces sp. SAI-117]MDH6581801.1 cadmium resistance protein CadD (predicted permease) [Streptomyces sp. SAI-133]MDH6613804.1 cadmium resistance protein CadD (predicted permease) [Streptomyces sp. SAI-135]